jgi:hypothetical protein
MRPGSSRHVLLSCCCSGSCGQAAGRLRTDVYIYFLRAVCGQQGILDLEATHLDLRQSELLQGQQASEQGQ